MAPNRFSPFGIYGESFASHQLRKVLAARAALAGGEVLDIESIDLTYEGYKKDNKTINEACVRDFPGSESDKAKKPVRTTIKVSRGSKLGTGLATVGKTEVDECLLYRLRPNLTSDCCCLCIAGYPSQFAAKVGLSSFRHNEARAGGQDIDPGSDNSSLSDSVTGDHDNADFDEEDDFWGKEDLESNHTHANSSHSNADLESIIDEATSGLARTRIQADDMRTHCVRCENVRIRRAEDTDINHVHMIIVELPPGAELSSVHFSVQQNKRDVVVTVHQAPEIQKGIEMLPLKALFDGNSTIAAALTLGLQNHLNSIPTDQDPHQPRPVLTASGRFSALVELAQLDPQELYLTNNGDMIITHRVPIHDDEGTVPAFVAIAFFLEEQKPQKKTRRKKFDRKLPVKPPENVSTDPHSPSKRARPSSPSLYHTPTHSPSS